MRHRTLVLVTLGSLLVATEARADALAEARAFIATQVGQIQAGDVAGLKAGFTDRLKDRITAEAVARARKEAGRYTLADLVHAVQPSGADLKIKMKNGRTLTTLVKVKGAWKADTIWFR
jgi:hypothetical protein